MSKIAVVYWSGTGNTETMANEIVSGIDVCGGSVELFNASKFSSSDVANFDLIAFGCPAMGCEVLEESEFEPMFEECKGSLSGKKIALFGSYDWGGGQWMTDWEAECSSVGAVLVCESLIVNNGPSDEDKANCNEFGKNLVSNL